LGSTKTEYKYSNPTAGMLETFENQYPNRNYLTEFVFNEFTSLCPKTGQPDFATISVSYIADRKCIETKSLKMYFMAYRNEGMFMETIVNQILEHCMSAIQPRKMLVTGRFNARGGTLINVMAEYEAD
jgi:7-cyano-7-deazaguanine reductase